jgi:hypothetical protein
MGNKIRGVAHREMISFGDHHLASVRKQPLPTLVKTERVIALAKDGEQRRLVEWSDKGAGNPPV